MARRAGFLILCPARPHLGMAVLRRYPPAKNKAWSLHPCRGLESGPHRRYRERSTWRATDRSQAEL